MGREEPAKAPAKSSDDLPVIESQDDFDRVLGGILQVPKDRLEIPGKKGDAARRRRKHSDKK